MTSFRTRYDEDAGAIYLQLQKGKIAHTVEFTQSVLIDVDETNRPLGVEFLDPNEMGPFVQRFFPNPARLQEEIGNRVRA